MRADKGYNLVWNRRIALIRLSMADNIEFKFGSVRVDGNPVNEKTKAVFVEDIG